MSYRIHLFIVAIFIAALNVNEGRAAQSFTPGFDIDDLNEAMSNDGAITPEGFDLVGIALPEIKKYPVSFNKYRSVHVRQSQKYYYVVFSPRELGSTAHGRLPSEQLFIEVQISKLTRQVIGSRAE